MQNIKKLQESVPRMYKLSNLINQGSRNANKIGSQFYFSTTATPAAAAPAPAAAPKKKDDAKKDAPKAKFNIGVLKENF